MQVIPQAVCSRHGLAIGADLIWLVKILMTISWPVSYPVGKVIVIVFQRRNAHLLLAMLRNHLTVSSNLRNWSYDF